MRPESELDCTSVLIGLESSGKSALFRSLTGHSTGDENNFRGSTVFVRRARMQNGMGELVDTPGIRLRDDSFTTQLALHNMGQGGRVLLVVRGTHAKREIEDLLCMLGPKLVGRRVALIITFDDLAPTQLRATVRDYETKLGLPIAAVNARNMSAPERSTILATMRRALPLPPLAMGSDSSLALEPLPEVQPGVTAFEHPVVGPWLSLFATIALFAVPIWLAFVFAAWMQPILDKSIIIPLTERTRGLETTSPLIFAMLAGSYGLLTLGPYSFVWAFPVVLFMAVAVAVTDETGVKDRITSALDPWMRRIGLSGKDLIPVLTGFGCNVVAAFQTRSCSRCTRRACMSLIAFGSACSYQIGATVSLFHSAGRPWLFLPYVVLLCLVGAVHTRIWNPTLQPYSATAINDRAFLQGATLRGVAWRVSSALRQFLFTAMPVFLLICVLGSILQHIGFLDLVVRLVAPLLHFLGLPAAVGPGIIFSVVRKDGLLVLNQDGGALIRSLSAAQVFLVVYLASTLTPCMVTLLTVAREFGARWGMRLALQQAVSSVVSTVLLTVVFRMLFA